MDCVFLKLQRPDHSNRERCDDTPHGSPSGGTAAPRKAASNGQVKTRLNGFDEAGQSLGRMLPVRIHHPKKRRIGMAPSVEDSAGEPAGVPTNQKTDPGVPASPRRDKLFGAVPAIVIHNQQLVWNTDGFEHRLDSGDQKRQIVRFPKRGQDQGKLVGTMNSLCHSETMMLAIYVR